jgi:hypothetical protein
MSRGSGAGRCCATRGALRTRAKLRVNTVFIVVSRKSVTDHPDRCGYELVESGVVNTFQ